MYYFLKVKFRDTIAHSIRLTSSTFYLQIFKLACIVRCNNAALALIATKGAEISNSYARFLTVAIPQNLRCVFDSQTCCNSLIVATLCITHADYQMLKIYRVVDSQHLCGIVHQAHRTRVHFPTMVSITLIGDNLFTHAPGRGAQVFKKIIKDFSWTAKSRPFQKHVQWITCSRWLGSRALLLDRKNSTYSWQSSARFMPERINKWSVGVGRWCLNV